MRKRVLWGALLGLLGMSLSPPLAAAGPVEAPAHLVISPSDPNLWVVRYDYGGGGFLYSRDAGASWNLVCNTAIDPSITKETAGVAVAPSGEVFTGVFTGLWEIGKGGCGGSMAEPFDGKWVSDVTQDPNDPSAIFAITSSGAMMNGLYSRDDASGAWSEIGTREQILISRVRVTQTDSGRRFYESIVDGEQMIATGENLPTGEPAYDYFPNYFIRYSDDEGETWTSHPGFAMTKGRVRLEAIDPTNPNRIVISETFGADNPEPDIIWVNDNAGDPDSYTKLAEVKTFGGVVFAPDGRLWYGDTDGSIYHLPVGETAGTEIGTDIRPRCLAYDGEGDRLIACKLIELVEVATDGTTKSLLDFRDQQDWVECDGQSVAPACEQQMAATNWCNITHFPNAKICAAYCYPGLNNMMIGQEGECPAGTMTPDGTIGGGPVSNGDGDSGTMGDGDGPAPAGSGDGDGMMTMEPMTPAPTMPPTTSGKGGDDGGCTIASDPARPVGLWIGVAFALLWIRRRRSS